MFLIIKTSFENLTEIWELEPYLENLETKALKMLFWTCLVVFIELGGCWKDKEMKKKVEGKDEEGDEAAMHAREEEKSNLVYYTAFVY